MMKVRYRIYTPRHEFNDDHLLELDISVHARHIKKGGLAVSNTLESIPH